jgi:hypothetical protein
MTSDPDNDDRDGHRNVGTLHTTNAADSPRRLHQISQMSYKTKTTPMLAEPNPESWSKHGVRHSLVLVTPINNLFIAYWSRNFLHQLNDYQLLK